jgi:hypothetical protein
MALAVRPLPFGGAIALIIEAFASIEADRVRTSFVRAVITSPMDGLTVT